jgi:hypothetical protein
LLRSAGFVIRSHPEPEVYICQCARMETSRAIPPLGFKEPI